MFDESTSAVDIKTEGIIYQLLNDLNIWFVTISHRPSLIQYHQKELKLYSKNIYNKENDFDLNNDIEIPIDLSSIRINEIQLENISIDDNNIELIIKSNNLLKEIKDLWKLIHLPFGSDHKILRIQVLKTKLILKFLFSFEDLCNMVYLFDNSRMLYIYILSFNCSNWCYF
jgi:hypothetical protein